MASDLDQDGRAPTRRGWGVALGLLLALGLGDGCYHGGERDKDPPPGLPGGLCLAPDGHCTEGTCNRDRNFCYDPLDPCDGFFCGGDERGFCFPDPMTQQPSCQCEVGYTNAQYDLYCCPDPSLGIFDPNCTAGG
ncbi:MAG: hypothetical protein H6712_17455 [Myxococcales bacterium]|nr:hypothetical protein [Myxococcales bacterium]